MAPSYEFFISRNRYIGLRRKRYRFFINRFVFRLYLVIVKNGNVRLVVFCRLDLESMPNDAKFRRCL